MMALRLQALRFAAVGLANTAVGLLVIWSAMYFLGTGPALANALGYTAGLLLGFTLNRRWTFGGGSRLSVALPRYLAMVAVSYSLNLLTVLSASGGGLNPYIAQLLGMAVYTATLFFGCRTVVFTQQHGSRSSSARTVCND